MGLNSFGIGGRADPGMVPAIGGDTIRKKQ